MRASEILTESFQFSEQPTFITDIHGWNNYNLYCELLEAEFNNKPILEDLDQSELHQLQLLAKLTIKNDPKVGESYIPIFVIYVHKGSLFVQGKLSFATIIKIHDGTYYFDNGQSYPNERLSKHMFTKLYLFDDDKNKQKFLNMITLSFQTIQPNLQECLYYESK